MTKMGLIPRRDADEYRIGANDVVMVRMEDHSVAALIAAGTDTESGVSPPRSRRGLIECADRCAILSQLEIGNGCPRNFAQVNDLRQGRANVTLGNHGATENNFKVGLSGFLARW
jgi:hypothetical protein